MKKGIEGVCLWAVLLVVIKASAPLFAADATQPWRFGLGREDTDEALAVTCDLVGNVYVFGKWEGFVDFSPGVGLDTDSSEGDFPDAFVASYDSLGSFRWMFAIHGMGDAQIFPSSLALSTGGDLLVGGAFDGEISFETLFGTATYQTSEFGGFNLDGFLIRLNLLGAEPLAEAVSIFRGSSDIVVRDVQPFRGDQALVVGEFRGNASFQLPGNFPAALNSNGGSRDGFLALVRSNGDVLANEIVGIGGPADDVAHGVAVGGPVNGENVYVVGGFDSTVDFDPGAGTAALTATGIGSDAFVARYRFPPALGVEFDSVVAITSPGEAVAKAVRLRDSGSENIWVGGDFGGDRISMGGPEGGFAEIDAGTNGCFLIRLNGNDSPLTGEPRAMQATSSPTELKSLYVDKSFGVVAGGTFRGAAEFGRREAEPGPFRLQADTSAGFLWILDGSRRTLAARAVGGPGISSVNGVAVRADNDLPGTSRGAMVTAVGSFTQELQVPDFRFPLFATGPGREAFVMRQYLWPLPELGIATFGNVGVSLSFTPQFLHSYRLQKGNDLIGWNTVVDFEDATSFKALLDEFGNPPVLKNFYRLKVLD